jgi:hypothetical protein
MDVEDRERPSVLSDPVRRRTPLDDLAENTAL